MSRRLAGVSITLGNTELARTPASTSSSARLSVSRATPDLAAA